MAIDWKTILSEFDGKPTLLQAIGKLRKAVEDETITIQQAQAEIAKLESQQKADEALINTAQTTANNALDLAKTNEKDIGTLDGQVAALETDLNNKQDKITKATSLSCKKIQTDSLSFTMELGSDSPEYDYGLLFASKNVVSTGRLKPSFADEKFFEWVLPAKSGTLATTDEIAELETKKLSKIDPNAVIQLRTINGDYAIFRNCKNTQSTSGIANFYSVEFPNSGERHTTVLAFKTNIKDDGKEYIIEFPFENGTVVLKEQLKTLFGNQSIVGTGNIDLYKHHIDISGQSGQIFIGENSAAGGQAFLEFYSSKNLKCDSLTDLKTLLGDTFVIDCHGVGWDNSSDKPVLIPYMDNSNLFYIGLDGFASMNTISLQNITFNDTVKTI